MHFNHRNWLVCEAALGDQTYLFHRAEPAFLGRVYDEDDAPIEGLTLSLSNGQVMAGIVWYDEPVLATDALAELADHAGKALDLYDGVLDVDLRKFLAEAIAEAGLSVPAVARRAGLNQQTLYNYLAARSDLKMQTYRRIIHALP